MKSKPHFCARSCRPNSRSCRALYLMLPGRRAHFAIPHLLPTLRFVSIPATLAVSLRKPLAARVFACRAQPNHSFWPTIWAVGGASWLVVAVAEIAYRWPISGTYVGGDYVLSSGARLLANTLEFLLSACVYRVLLGQGWPARALARVRVVTLHVVLAVAVSMLATTALDLSAAVVDGHAGPLQDTLSRLATCANPSEFARLLRSWLPPYALGFALVALASLARRYHRDAVHMATLSADYANARLAMLSAQLQPHFLFNSLHAIAELTDESPARANEMIARLGDFLRHALESSKQRWVSVETEFAGLEAYIAVQHTRFGDRLQVQLNVDPDALPLTMPSLLLQPVVENAIEHGRYGPDPLLVVRIGVRRTAAQLRFQITNSTPRLPSVLESSGYGNGLSNVEARLKAAYGKEGDLWVGPYDGGGTLAELVMPALLSPPEGVQS